MVYITMNMYKNLNDTTFFTLNELTLLSKIYYWTTKCGRHIEGLNGKWIYNTLKDWHEQFNFWSMSTLRRTIKSLEESGILLSKKVNAKRWKHTKWYSIDFNKLNKLANNNVKQNNDTIQRDNKKKKNSNITPIKKRTNRCVQNEQIIYTNSIYTKDTKVSSSKIRNNKNILKSLNQEFDSKLNKVTEKQVYKKLSYKNENKETESKLSKEQLERVKEMKKVWNKIFEYSINPTKAYINKSNEKSLYRLIEEKFEGDIDKWKEYACKVNSSKFLMGEKKTKKDFKASFAWLIKEETVDKINAGEYGIGDRELDINNVSSNVEAQKEEIIKTAEKKITEYVKQKIDDKKEKKELENYIKKEEYMEDSDKYGIGIYVQNIGSYNLVNNPDNKGILKTIYETYIVKKYFRRSRFKIREQLREMVNKQMKEESILGSFNLLKNIKDSLNFNCIEKSNIDLLTC